MAKREQPVANYLILTRECSKSLNKTSKNGAQNGKSAHRRAVLSRPEGEKNGLNMENCCENPCGCGGVPCGGTAFCRGFCFPLRGRLCLHGILASLEEKAFCCPAHTKSLKKRRAGCTIPLLYKAAFAALLPTTLPPRTEARPRAAKAGRRRASVPRPAERGGINHGRTAQQLFDRHH